MVFGARNVQFVEEDLGHFVVVVLPRMVDHLLATRASPQYTRHGRSLDELRSSADDSDDLRHADGSPRRPLGKAEIIGRPRQTDKCEVIRYRRWLTFRNAQTPVPGWSSTGPSAMAENFPPGRCAKVLASPRRPKPRRSRPTDRPAGRRPRQPSGQAVA